MTTCPTSVATDTGNWPVRSGRRFLTDWSKRHFPDQSVNNFFLILSPFFDHFRIKRQVGIVFFMQNNFIEGTNNLYQLI